MSADTVRHSSTYIILFLTRHNESINDDKNDDLYTSSPCLTHSGFVLLMWRHNRLLMTSQWPDTCDAITSITISNSLDIDFIHGDIHGRSCKKWCFVITWLYINRIEKQSYRCHATPQAATPQVMMSYLSKSELTSVVSYHALHYAPD